MGFLKELNKYFVKYGEIAIKKTEIIAQLAKVKIEIKKREMEIEKVKIEIGEYVISWAFMLLGVSALMLARRRFTA